MRAKYSLRQIVCDECGNIIARGQRVQVLPPIGPREGRPLLDAHEGKCERALLAKHPGYDRWHTTKNSVLSIFSIAQPRNYKE